MERAPEIKESCVSIWFNIDALAVSLIYPKKSIKLRKTFIERQFLLQSDCFRRFYYKKNLFIVNQ